MKVLKFGGTSVGTAERMQAVADIVNDGEQKVVVLSAMSGTTNKLIELVEYIRKKNNPSALELIHSLEQQYRGVVASLLKDKDYQLRAYQLINSHFDKMRSYLRQMFTIHQEKLILSQGEMLSTALLHLLMQEQGVDAQLISALEFMRVDKDGEPDEFYIRENIQRLIDQNEDCKLFITQGFVCRNAYGEVDNLERGGSDYSATLIGVAVRASEIQIWTDIDGFHNNDPREVDNTRPLLQLSFDEAAELAYFGAKIMHPSSILPAKLSDIPVLLKNTLQPQEQGTTINSICSTDGIRAVAAKDGITAIKIKSGRMLMAHGFLRKVFEVFELYKTAIDVITTSEVAVSVTIDKPKNLEQIVSELKKYGTVEVDSHLSIVCVVGDFIAERAGLAAELFDAVKAVPVRMISYGGSRHNITLLVTEDNKRDILQALNTNLLHNN